MPVQTGTTQTVQYRAVAGQTPLSHLATSSHFSELRRKNTSLSNTVLYRQCNEKVSYQSVGHTLVLTSANCNNSNSKQSIFFCGTHRDPCNTIQNIIPVFPTYQPPSAGIVLAFAPVGRQIPRFLQQIYLSLLWGRGG